MRNNSFTYIRSMMILQNMGKDKGKLKSKNKYESNNMAINHMGIVN